MSAIAETSTTDVSSRDRGSSSASLSAAAASVAAFTTFATASAALAAATGADAVVVDASDAASAASVLDVARDVFAAIDAAPRWKSTPAWLLLLILAEMLPLVPTQPFALLSGALLGPTCGAGACLLGYVAAASASYGVARGAGAAFARAVVKEEVEQGGADDEKEDANAFAARWKTIQARLASATPTEQTALIALYRSTPHPFSASSYLFGLARTPFAPYVAGTALGSAPWSALYGAVGAYVRELLDGGEGIERALADGRALLEADVLEAETAALAIGSGVLFTAAARLAAARWTESRSS